MTRSLTLASIYSGCFTQQNHVECDLYDLLLKQVNPGLACALMTFLVAVTEHLTEEARKRSVCFGLRFQGTPSTMAGKVSRMTLCLQKSSAAASHGSQSRRQ